MGVIGGGSTYWWLTRYVWPKQQERLLEEIQQSGRKAGRQDIIQLVDPIFHDSTQSLKGMAELVEAAVLELIVEFQRVTDSALADSTLTTEQFSGASQPWEETLLEDTKSMMEMFTESVIRSSNLGTNVVLVVGEVKSRANSISPIFEEIEFIADQTKLLP